MTCTAEVRQIARCEGGMAKLRQLDLPSSVSYSDDKRVEHRKTSQSLNSCGQESIWGATESVEVTLGLQS